MDFTQRDTRSRSTRALLVIVALGVTGLSLVHLRLGSSWEGPGAFDPGQGAGEARSGDRADGVVLVGPAHPIARATVQGEAGESAAVRALETVVVEVVDARTASALPDAEVGVLRAEQVVLLGKTDQDGRIEILPDEGVLEQDDLHFARSGYVARSMPAQRLLASEGAVFRVELDPGVRVEGRVVLVDGSPIQARTRVVVARTDYNLSLNAARTIGLGGRVTGCHVVETDEFGAFFIDGLEDGREHFALVGGAGYVTGSVPPTFRVGAELSVVVPVECLYGLAVEAVDRAGAPIALDRRVRILGEGGYSQPGGLGHFAAPDLRLLVAGIRQGELGEEDNVLFVAVASSPADLEEVGPVTFSLAAPGCDLIRSESPLPRWHGLEIPRRRVALECSTESGVLDLEILGGHVEAPSPRDRNERRSRLVLAPRDAGKRLELSLSTLAASTQRWEVPTGEYEVTLLTPGARPIAVHPSRVSIGRGETSKVTADLSGRSTAWIEVLDEQGAQYRGRLMVLVSRATRTNAGSYVALDWPYRISGLEDGDYVFSASTGMTLSPPGRESHRGELRLDASQTTEARVRLQRVK